MIRVIDSSKIDFIDRTKNDLIVGTHNGIFHCDEVIATSILAILNGLRGNTYIIRSRNLELLSKNADILVDVGEGEYDHHQKGGNGKRENNIAYASAGLIWKEFGSYLIYLLSDFKLTPAEAVELAKIIDTELIQSIDIEDNEGKATNHPFTFIKSFLPCWNQEDNYDTKFEQCINVICPSLKNIIDTYIAKFLAPGELKTRFNNPETRLGNILLIPSQTFPWEEGIIAYNENTENKIDFVVFPYPDGGYALQCVPPSLGEKFMQRIPLPISWAGESNNLPSISGIPTAIRCHNGRFFARAWDYNDIINMCELATKEFLENQNNISRK